MKNKLLIFSTQTYAYLAQEVAKLGTFSLGDVEQRDFPDGERYQRILTDVKAKDVVLLGGTVSDTDSLTIYDLACALVKYGAKTLTLVIPYFGYSTMERATKSGEVVTAKTRARLFSAIPMASYSNRVVLVDLHSEGIPHYFEGSIRPFHLYAKEIILSSIKQLAARNSVLACTDAGRAKWVESLANEMGIKPSFVYKKRIDGKTTEIVSISAEVEGKNVIIYDDMIRTGNSLINAAKAYKSAGAKSIAVVATHGVFPGNALEHIKSSGLFTKIICTNTHPKAVKLRSSFLIVKSIAPVITDFLKENFNEAN